MIIKQYYEEIANTIDLEIESTDITGNDIIDDCLKAIRILQKAISDIRKCCNLKQFFLERRRNYLF